MNEIIEKLEKMVILNNISNDVNKKLVNLSKNELSEYKFYIDNRLNSFSNDEIVKVSQLINSNINSEINSESTEIELARFHDLYNTLCLSKNLERLINNKM